MSTIEGSLPSEILELSPYAPTRCTVRAKPLDTEELRKTETYWRACNYPRPRNDLLQGAVREAKPNLILAIAQKCWAPVPRMLEATIVLELLI